MRGWTKSISTAHSIGATSAGRPACRGNAAGKFLEAGRAVMEKECLKLQKGITRSLVRQMESLLSRDDWMITNLANGSALLMEEIDGINWAGFYLMRENALVLGPFQGKPACTRIPAAKGVCGCAAAENRTLRVPDTGAFPGYISCDGATRSEIVVPLHNENGGVIGVMDLDSDLPDRFSEEDQHILEETAGAVERAIAGVPE